MKNFVPKFLLQLGLLILISATAQAAELFPEDAYSGYQADIKNGETLYNAGACGSCHGAADNHDLLGGGLKMSSYVGTFYVPNLSNSTKGIANWTNAAFLNAMLNGVSPKGRHYYPVFPYTSYAGMKPEDVLDIKAFIKTLSKSDNKVDAHEISFPYNVNAAMSYWKRSNFSTPRWSPGKDDQLARGKYLVENVGACGSCHTPRSTTFGLETDKALKGGKGLTGGYAPAIDASVMAALPSPDAFIKGVLVEGKKLNGQPIVDPVMRKIVKQTAKLSKSDRLAIFAYLKGSEVKIQKQKLTVQTCSANVTAATNTGNANTDALSASADDFIGKYCRNCHGLGQSAQGSFPAGSLSAIAADASFITPGSPSTSRLYKSILSGRMPIGGTKPSQGEIQGLADWITALGSKQASAIPAPVASLPPRMRKIIKRDVMVRAALADVSGQSELDRPFIRYFSYRSHYNGRFPCETEKQYSKRQSLYIAGLNKMLNSVSLGARLVVPETVANTKELLVRVDIRDLGWDQYQWDVLVNAYPYGVDPHSDPSLSALTKETHSVLPIMRSDWFLANSSRPSIYHALLNLPKNIRELERRLGINVEDNIANANVVRAAFDRGASGVSANNRMVERHDLPQGGYYWKSYDFAGSFGTQSLRDFPHGPEDVHLPLGLKSFEHDGGEMIFSLPNGLQGYYLSDNKGNRIDEGPEKIVSYQQRPKDKPPTIINGRSCFDCHADGILTKLDSMREHIKTTNRFDIEQSKLLLTMYIKQVEMDKFYDGDQDRFLRSLDRIGATEKGIDGRPKSRVAPGNKEIISWYADLYEDNLDLEAFAAEFEMEAEEFKAAINRISDPHVQQIARQKILQLEAGATVPRFEIEQQFPYLQKALTGLDPLTTQHISEYNAQYGSSASQTKYVEPVKQVHAEQAYKVGPAKKIASSADVYAAVVPQYQQKVYAEGSKLELSLSVAKTHVRVGDKLAFSIKSNKDCEMQILYVESNGTVEVFPSQLIGDPWLRANKPKHIPLAGAGNIEFDEPGHAETLIIFCSQNGLGADRLTTKAARAIAINSNKTTTRGISFNLTKKVESSKGTSAFHTVSFEVTP